jgi:septum formation protein
MLNTDRIVLASNSPRRQELLSITGWSFSKAPANIDESPHGGELPDMYVRRLAVEKAENCKTNITGLILSADTIVVNGGHLLGKPVDETDAVQMLKNLRGHAHRVMTAIALMDRETGRLEQDLCSTNVRMRNYSDEEIVAYVKSGDPLDKAGAYAAI